MGLDQYARWTDGTKDEYGDERQEDFKYWRKTNHIQNWMQRLYAEKTGDNDPQNFNCVQVEITYADLLKFITDVKEGNTQCTDGFFFGVGYDTSDPDVVEEDLRFAADCFFHLMMGRKVFYSSWW